MGCRAIYPPPEIIRYVARGPALKRGRERYLDARVPYKVGQLHIGVAGLGTALWGACKWSPGTLRLNPEGASQQFDPACRGHAASRGQLRDTPNTKPEFLP